MNKIVVDSSVAIKWLVPEVLSDKAQLTLESYRGEALTLFAPDFIYAEVGNIVWKKNRF